MELHSARPNLASKNLKNLSNFENVFPSIWFNHSAWFLSLFCQYSIPQCQFTTTTALVGAFRKALWDRKLFWCFLKSYKVKIRTAQGHWPGSRNVLILDPLFHCGTSLCATQLSLKKPKKGEKFLGCHPEHKIWLFSLFYVFILPIFYSSVSVYHNAYFGRGL